MATYVLIHGAGDGAWYWHLVEAELRQRGHGVVAMDLPSDDKSASLSEYANTVVDAIGNRTNLIVVAQSFGGFTAPLVCDRLPVDLLVMLAAMIPSPGERPDDWGENTGYESTGDFEGEDALFFHDVPPNLVVEAKKRGRDQSGTPGEMPWPLKAWPDVPTKVLLCRDDRLFATEFMRRVARDRLNITPDEIDGGHCIALSRPKELAERLDSYLTRTDP